MSTAARRRVLRASVATAAALGAGGAVRGARASSDGGSGATGRSAAASAFAFALLGDVPYGEAGAARFERVLRRLDAEPLACVIHVGDLKGGEEPCDDALLGRRVRLLATSAHPLVLLPGDNDWADCARLSAGAHDPLERLDALRRLAFAAPEALGRDPATRRSLGLQRQPGWPENVYWRIADVHFVGLHVVGGGDGRDDAPSLQTAALERRQAVLAWLSTCRAAALRDQGGALVVAFHANPGFRRTSPAYDDFVEALRATAEAFGGPILLLHGDTHMFRADHPLLDARGRPFAHVTRVECFGHPLDRAWVRITHDPGLPGRFSVATRELPLDPSP
jgi:hypothetical protein